MTKKISRLYDDYPSAREAVDELETAGVKSGDISIVASNAEGWYEADDDDVDDDDIDDDDIDDDDVDHVDVRHDKDRDGVDDRTEGARTGAGVGGVAVGAAGLAAGLGLLAIPGIGPIVAAGWAVSTLAGVAAGGITGGIIGALVESGVNKNEADVYAESIRRGGALVVARVADADAARLQSVLDRSGVNASERAGEYRAEGWTHFDPEAPPYSGEEIGKDREFTR